MGTYRCGLCGTKWPLQAEFATCPRCDEPCKHRQFENPDEDWSSRLAVAQAEDLETALQPLDKVVAWRVAELVRAGVPRDIAIEWAEARLPASEGGGPALELRATVNRLGELQSQGATLEEAIHIVWPLC